MKVAYPTKLNIERLPDDPLSSWDENGILTLDFVAIGKVLADLETRLAALEGEKG